MAERQFPPPGDPARFDAIVGRGASLRRRRLLGRGAGLGGSAAAALLAVVLITGPGGGTPSPAVVADSADPVTTEAPAAPEQLTVTVDSDPDTAGSDAAASDTADPDTVRVVVDDPAQVIADGSRQCLTVTVTDPADGDLGAVAEGYGCAEPGSAATDGTAARVELRPTSPTEITCPASLDAGVEVDTDRTARVRSTFDLITTGVPAGDWVVEVTASSGPGDGCSPDPAPGEARGTVTAELASR